MTRDEFITEIEDIVRVYRWHPKMLVDRILAFLKKEGWKSPEEVQEIIDIILGKGGR